MEDLGWYVVDNLPPSMVPSLVNLASTQGLSKITVVLDVRSPQLVDQLPQVFATLTDAGISHEVLFVEAADEVIVKRQESSRRPLPLQGEGRLLDAIERERDMLSSVRATADLVIDTGKLTVHQLASRVAHAYGGEAGGMVKIAIMSFGFKNGLPIDADLVFDVRFLPNPYWVPELRPKTGLSEEVSDYVLAQPGAAEFMDTMQQLLTIMTPGYVREGKRQLTLAIGCTGGKHRSTAISQEMARRLTDRGFNVAVLHRDLGLE